MKTWEPTEDNGRAGIHGSRVLLALAGVAGLLALILAIAALTARGENPLAYPTVIPPPPVTPATPPSPPANPGPDIFGPASDTGNANNTPTPPQQAGAKPDANADLPTETSLNCPAKFIMCLAQDHQGNIWAGSEDDGCLRYTPPRDATPDAKGTWTQFTGADLGGDNSVYAIAVDKLNRVWCGTLNHGVAVYNGEKWQSYSVIADPTTGTLAGPLGARVFAIATSPLDGDIWIATDAGLSRYSLSKDTWSYYTRGMSAGSFVAETQGLPSDQIAGIAFTKKGRILLATQCDGVATADPVDGYKKFRNIRGPDLIPVTPTGDGLPTSLCNAILVAHDGTIYLATTTGLAMSKDDGDSWQYIRGRDYADKARGLYQPRGLVLPTPTVASQLLPEDYVVSLAEDTQHRLWVGYRAQGYTVTDPATGTSFWSKSDPKITEKNGYITAILPISSPNRPASPFRNGPQPPTSSRLTYIARYGAGISRFNPNPPIQEPAPGEKRSPSPGGLFLVPDDLHDTPSPPPPTAGAPNSTSLPPLPLGARAPTADELTALARNLKSLPSVSDSVAYLGDDWITQGDWVGRYGRKNAVLCAADSPMDHLISSDLTYEIAGSLRIPYKGDSLRRWIQWLHADSQSSLYDPIVGHRRQAEWDDHGEAYNRNTEGPDLKIEVHIPADGALISLYFMNKDAHGGATSNRDFVVELTSRGAGPTAHTRVVSFAGGVYKTFAVSKAGDYTFVILRNHSFDAIVSGVFVDMVSTPITKPGLHPMPMMGYRSYDPPNDPDELLVQDALTPPTPTNLAARTVMATLNALRKSSKLSAMPYLPPLKIIVYRAAQASGAPKIQLQAWRWDAHLWTADDRDGFNRAMQEAHESFLSVNPQLKGLAL